MKNQNRNRSTASIARFFASALLIYAMLLAPMQAYTRTTTQPAPPKTAETATGVFKPTFALNYISGIATYISDWFTVQRTTEQSEPERASELDESISTQSQPTPPTSDKPLLEQTEDSKDGDSSVQNLVTNSTYPFTSSTSATLEDMTSGTSPLVTAGSDDGNSTPLSNIGFDFWLDGLRYTQFGVNANGFMRLGALSTGTAFDNAASTGFNSTTNAPKIAPYYDDIWVGTNGQVHFKVVGSAPNRKLVVEWRNMTIPRQSSVTTGAGTFQAWLYESTGVIEFVYGSGIILNTVQGGYSVGLQSGAATNFVSVTTTTPSASQSTANNTQTNAITSGTKYTFTPAVPNAPAGPLSFTSVTATGMTLNWTDNSTNEQGFAIYRSDDGGSTYNFISQAAGNATTSAQTGLSAGTTYFWRVYAVSEGALSSALPGSQATTAGTTYTWNQTGSAAYGTAANWTPARTTPASTDILVFNNGATTSATGVTAQSIGQIVVSNNTNLTLTSSVGSNITITGGGGTDFDIQSGSTLSLSSAAGTLGFIYSGSGHTGNIAGTLTTTSSGSYNAANSTTTINGTINNNGAYTATSGTTIVNGTVNNTNGFTGSQTSVTFANGSNYNHQFTTTSGTIPPVNWGATSNVNITSYTSNSSIPTNLTNQTFGNLTWNCPAQTGGINLAGNTLTVAGTFTMASTGSSSLRLVSTGTGLLSVGNFSQTGGTLELSNGTGSGTIRVSGTFNQSGGTLTETAGGSGIIEFNGTSNQSVTVGGTISNTINYRINNNSGITLSGTLPVTTGASMTVSSGGTPITGGTVNYTGTTSLIYNGTAAAQTASGEFPSSNGPTNLTINNTNASPNNTVTLPFSRSISGTLTLTAGTLVTTGNLLTLTNTATGAISGGSATSFVNGPLARTLPASLASGSTYTFPVGKSALKLFELVNPTTAPGGTVTVQTEAFDANAGGTAGSGINGLFTNRYWLASASGAGTLTNTTVRLTDSPVGSRIGQSATQTGTYNSIGGTVVGSTILSNTITSLGYFVMGIVTISGTVSVCNGGTYPTLKSFFDEVNTSTVSGNIIVNIDGNCAEGTATATLNQWSEVPANSNYTMTIQPSGGAARTISGATTAGNPLIDLNGADRVTIDGLNTGGNTLTISNTTASATANTSTVRFRDDATGNTITNSTILGSSTMTMNTAGGTVFFSTGTTTGNDGNTISNNNVGPAGANLSTKAIYSLGTAGAASNTSGVTINNNNIFDFFNATTSVSGIYVDSGNDNWTISNNRIYQTASRTFTGASLRYAGITLNPTAAPLGAFTVTGNTIGFADANGNGTTTITGSSNAFRGIDALNTSTTTATSIQGNTIAGIVQTTSLDSNGEASGPFIGIMAGENNGLFNIGNITGNTLGSLTGTGSITINRSAPSASTPPIGIFDWSTTATSNISNNNIGSISVINLSTSIGGFYGIKVNKVVATTTTSTISNNIIGGSTAGSISTNTDGQVVGILSQNTTPTITGNTVRNLAYGGNSALTGTSAPLIGISSASTAAAYANQTISQNTIHSLSFTYSGGVNTVTGLAYNAPATGTNIVAGNFIHSFSVANAAGTLNGIDAVGGNATYQNNMIRLGVNSAGNTTLASKINGINSASTGTVNFYFNSVNIGGTGVNTNANNTFAFNSSTTGNTRILRNNIFSNTRSNATTGGKHYAVSVGGTSTNPTGLTINNNLYNASGTGGVFGLYNAADRADLAAWKTAVGQDANSFQGDPLFVTPNGTSATVDLHILNGASPASNSGAAISGITNDFDNDTRNATTPDIGADEFTPPTVSVTGGPLTFPDTLVGAFSAEQTYTVSGADLTADLVVTAPADFQVSTTSGSGFGSSVSLTQTGGTVSTTTIYVRFAPTSSPGAKTGNITNASTNALTQNVAVSGNALSLSTITTTGGPLTFPSTGVGSTSAEQTYTVSGTDLTANLVITAPTHFEISTTSGTGFGSTITLTPSNGTVSTTTIYVRYAPTAVGTHSGNITNASTGALTKNIAVDGVAAAVATKLVITSISPTTPTVGGNFSVTVQTQDESNTAVNLQSSVDFTLTNNGGGTLGGTVNQTIPAGSNNIVIPNLTLSESGTGITLTATRTAGQTLAPGTSAPFNVLGAEPTTQATNVVFSYVSSTSMTLSWTNGNGTNRLVTARASNFTAVAPTDGTSYTANTVFGNGQTTGTNNFVVYNGTGNSVTVTGLTVGTTYTFNVYEFNGSNGTENYLTTSPATASQETSIVSWTFPTGSTDAIADGGIAANSARTISAVNAQSLTFNSSGNGGFTARATNWNSGNNSKHWKVSFTTLGYTALRISSKQRSSGSGPRDFKLQYSLNDSTWVDVSGGTITTADNYSTGVLTNLILPAATEHQSNVYLRWIMTSNTAVDGTTVPTGGASNIDDIIVTGTATPGIATTGTVSPFGNVVVGSTSSEQSYTVAGGNLTNNLVITAPTHFEISTTSGSNFGSSITLTPTNGTVPNTTIYVRFAPQSAGIRNSSITHTSTGATSRNVSVSGTGITPYSGSYDVCNGGFYPTLYSFFSALGNQAVMTGDITVNIAGNCNETFSSQINNFTESPSGSNYSITIKPSGGAARTVSISANETPLYLNRSNITIDGLNTDGNSLTLRQPIGNNATVFFNGQISNINIKNTTIEAGNNGYGIYITGGVTSPGSSNITITGNTIRDLTTTNSLPNYLIYAQSFANFDDNLVITNNTLLNANDTAIFISQRKNTTISGNNISATQPLSGNFTGIQTERDLGTNTISGNTISNIDAAGSFTGIRTEPSGTINISGNKIYSISDSTSTSNPWVGIQNSGYLQTGAPTSVYNNFISLVPSAASGKNIKGIYNTQSRDNNFNYYFNTVLLGGTANSGNSSWAFLRDNAGASSTNVTNNIFFNDRTGGTGSHYAVGDQAAGTGTWTSGNNIFVGTGATAANFFDYSTTTETPVDFTAWQAAGRDSNSTASNPTGLYTVSNMFVSATDLHMNPTNGTAANGGGVNIPGITTDIDNETRNATTPDIGADEFTPTPVITITGGPLNFGNTTVGSTSAEQSYSVSGNSLSADLVINTPSSDFEISTASGSGFGSTISLTPAGGTVPNTTIYVRFKPQSVGSISGNIAHTSTGATQQNVIVGGTGVIYGTISFSGAPYTDSETNTNHNVTITVQRAGGANGAVAVTYSTSDGTAEAGSDYTATSGTLNWADGDFADKTFTIPVTGDQTFEPDETVNLTLSNATGGASVGTPNPTTLTITNDDAAVADHLTFVNVPTTGTVGTNLSTFTVEARRADNSVDTNYTGNITITKASGAGNLTGTTTKAAVAGVAAFNDLQFDAAGGYTLNADSGTLTQAVSGTITVSPNPADVHYRTIATGNWNTASVWEISTDLVNWSPASVGPSSANNTITIRSGHTVTVNAAISTDQTTIDAGGTVIANVPAFSLTVNDGAGAVDMQVNGTLNVSGVFSVQSGAGVAFGSGGKYVHALNGGTIPTATWDANSTIEVTGITTSAPIFNGLVTYGNITWNSPSQTAVSSLSGNLRNLAGNLTIVSTGSSSIQLVGAQSVITITIGGDLNIQGGTLSFSNGNASNSVLILGGSFNQTGGVFDGDSTSSAMTFRFTGVNKTFTRSAGTIVATDINWQINTGASLSLINDLPVASGRTLTVNTTGTLDVGTKAVTGAGAITVNGTLRLGGAIGAQNSTAGANIQVTGGKNFSGTIVFNGTDNQTVGADFPATVGYLTINNTGTAPNNIVTGNANQSVAGVLRVLAGTYAGTNQTTGSFGSVLIAGGATLMPAANGVINFTGDWDTQGTFIANNGTVNINGNGPPSLLGNTTFHNLSKATATAQTLWFNPGTTTTVTGTLTLTGAPGQLLTLRSGGSGTWNLIASSSQNVNYVNVKDSNASGGQTIRAANSVNAGNNINWSFSPGTISFVGAPYTDSETNADHTFNVTVSRTIGNVGAVSVDYAIANGTATVADNDYSVSSANGTLTWNDGDAADKTLTITVKGDRKAETDETVNLTLSNATGGATLGTPNPTTLTITNDDNAPVAQNVIETATAGTAKTINLTATDADGDNLTFSIVGAPANGSLGAISTPVCNAGNCTATVQYTASPISYTGPDSFTYKANDGANDSLAATVSLTVSSGNTNPTIGAISDRSVTVDNTVIMPVLVGDAETPVNALTVAASSGDTLVVPNANLVFSGTGANRSLSVTPASQGTSLITVTVTDGSGATASTTFTVTANAAVCTAPPQGMVAWYSAEGSADDIFGNYNGTLAGDAAYSSGKVGQAFTFDGNGDYVSVPNAPALNLNQHTLDAWINRGAGSGNYSGIIVKQNADNTGRNYYLGLNPDNRLHYSIYDGSSYHSVDGARVIPENQWVFVAAVYDGSTMSVYVNGQLDASINVGTITPATTTEPVTIGWTNENDNRYFNGAIDEVEIFGQALSQPDIAAIYNASTAGKCQVYRTLTVNSVNGTVTKLPNRASYLNGSTVQLTAVPNAGYTFAGWTGDITSSSNPLSVTMDADKTITANYTALPTGTISLVDAPYTVSESNTDQTFNVTVRRSGGTYGAVTVDYAVTDGTATVGGDDYAVSPASGTLVWTDGDDLDKTISITVKGDTKFENAETVNIALSNVSGGTISGTSTTTLTITNDDAAPTISIGNATATEGGNAVFTVTQSAPSELNTSFLYSTTDGSATAGQDYTSASSISGGITAGQTTTTITISTLQDTLAEGVENFTVTLSTPLNAAIDTATGTASITDNDNAPVAQNVNETATAGTAKTITLTASDADGDNLTFSIVDTPDHGTLGAISTPVCNTGACTATVQYTAAPNTYAGPDSFTYKASDGTNESNTATVSITVTAAPSGTLQLSSAVFGTGETNADYTINIPVTRTGGSAGAVSVSYSVTDGTATTAGNDYSIGTPPYTLSWADGDTSDKNIVITVKGDTNFEADETVNISINTPTGSATLGAPSSAVLTITNDDPNNIVFNADGNLPAGTYDSITINAPAVVTMTGSVTANGNVIVKNGATLRFGTNILSGAGSFTAENGSTISLGDPNGIASSGASGNVQMTGTRSFNAGMSVIYNGAVNQTVGGGLPNPVANLTIANTGGAGANTVTGNPGQSVTGTLHVQSGNYQSASDYNNVLIDAGATWTAGAGETINVSGNWTNNGTFNAGSSTVVFNGTGAQSIGGASVTAFNNLSINKSAETATLGNNISAAALSIQAGTLSQGAASSVTAGSVTVSAGATWSNSGTGDVTLGGAVSNAGTISFNAVGAGCGADDILIRSTVSGTQRAWSGGGTFSMSDVDVKDMGGTAIITVNGGTNSGNNGLFWLFVPTCAGGIYTWNGGSLGGEWNVATNWTPARALPNASDILIIDGAITPTPVISNVPTQTIAALRLVNNPQASLAALSADTTLTISGATGTDLAVPTGSLLKLNGANALTINVASGSYGTVGGSFILDGAGHRLVGNAAGAINFQFDSICTTSDTFTGFPFGDGITAGTPDSIVFEGGSTYFHNAGGSPFGNAVSPVAVFQSASTAVWLKNEGFQASGRTYGNLIVGATDPGGEAVNLSHGGSGNFSFENLTINSTNSLTSSLTFNGSGTGSVIIGGDITSVGAGAESGSSDVNITAGSGGIVLNKAGTQTFSGGSGRTVTFGSEASVSNATTLSLSRNLIVSDPSVLSVSGSLTAGAYGYVVGNLKKFFTAPGAHSFEVGTTNGYSPVDANVTSGTGDLTVKATQSKLSAIPGNRALQRYWTLTEGGSITADLTFNYLDADIPVSATEANFDLYKYDGALTPVASTPDDANNKVATSGITSFSDWTLAEPAAISAGTLNLDQASYSVNENGASLTIQVTRTGGSGGAASVGYATPDGTAIAGEDYTTASGTLTWTDGDAATKTFSIPIADNSIFEGAQSFTVSISGAAGAVLGSQNSAAVTINDSEDTPTLSVGDVTFTGADSLAVSGFVVTLTGQTEVPVTVNYATADGTAIAGQDYTSTSGTLTFNPGDATEEVQVSILADNIQEASEFFYLNLSTPAGATISDGQGVGTIPNDDAAPTFAIGNASVAEGGSGTTNINFTVTRTGATDLSSTVSFTTQNGTATGGASCSGDFNSATGSVVFAPGDATKQITISVCGDAVFETDETFIVELTGTTNGTISGATGTGTITNDDAAPTISINDAALTEGDAGTTDLVFTVTKSGATEVASQVSFATADGTINPATGGASCGGSVDYETASGTINFNASETQKTITVKVCGDGVSESAETFFGNLSAPSGATISDGQGLGTIQDNEAAISITASLPSGLTALNNTILTIPVTVSDTTGQGVSSYDFRLSYDPAVITPAATSFDTAGTLSSGFTVTPDASTPGSLRITGTGALSGAGVLINLRFNVAGAPPNCSAFSFSAFSFNNGQANAALSGPGSMCVRTGSIDGRVTYGTNPMLQTVPGVVINASGNPNLSATTDAGGLYSLSGFGAGAYTLMPSKSGDISAGSISGYDASLIAQQAVNMVSMTSNQRIAADVSGNGAITSFDAAMVAQYTVGITLSQPNNSGKWKFVEPGRTYTNVWADYTAQDFVALLLGDVTGNWTPAGTRAEEADNKQFPNAVRISMTDASVSSGSDIIVPVNISDVTNRGLYSFDFEIAFDPDVLELADGGVTALRQTEEESLELNASKDILSTSTMVENSGALSRNFSFAVNQTAKGVVRITGYGVSPLEGAGELLRLKFRVRNGVAATKTGISWSAVQLNEGSIPVAAKSALVRISEEFRQ